MFSPKSFLSSLFTVCAGHNVFTSVIMPKSPSGRILGSLFYTATCWQALQVSKIDKQAKGGKQDSVWSTIGGVFFPGWYSAFKVGKYVPNGNSIFHVLGQMFLAPFYSAFQLAKLREQKMPKDSSGTFEKGLAIMVPEAYGPYAATTLANQASKLFPPKSPVASGVYTMPAALAPQPVMMSQPMALNRPVAVIPPQPLRFQPQPVVYTYSPSL